MIFNYLKKVPSNELRIRNQKTARYLASTSFGFVYASKGCFNIFKRWNFIKANDDLHFIKNSFTGLYLTSKGNRVYANRFKGNEHQKWRITGSLIVNKPTGLALDSNKYGRVYLLKSNGGKNQQWLYLGSINFFNKKY